MKCITPKCHSTKIRARGLCKRCYDRLTKQVQRKTTTWDELVAKGLANNAKNPGYSQQCREALSNIDKVRLRLWKERRFDQYSLYYDPDGTRPEFQTLRDFVAKTERK